MGGVKGTEVPGTQREADVRRLFLSCSSAIGVCNSKMHSRQFSSSWTHMACHISKQFLQCNASLCLPKYSRSSLDIPS